MVEMTVDSTDTSPVLAQSFCMLYPPCSSWKKQRKGKKKTEEAKAIRGSSISENLDFKTVFSVSLDAM
nr:putative flower spur development protein [Impatiens uliginosa]